MKRFITAFELKVVKCDCGSVMVRDTRIKVYKCRRCKSIYDRDGKPLYKSNLNKQLL